MFIVYLGVQITTTKQQKVCKQPNNNRCTNNKRCANNKTIKVYLGVQITQQ